MFLDGMMSQIGREVLGRGKGQGFLKRASVREALNPNPEP